MNEYEYEGIKTRPTKGNHAKEMDSEQMVKQSIGRDERIACSHLRDKLNNHQ